jgi:hypothetical protein
MNAYSATEAIWPALERTCAYLFRPFKVEMFLKLAAVATLSEGFLVSFRFAVPGAWPFARAEAGAHALLRSPEILPVAALAAAALLVLGVYGFLLVTRLRLAFVHSLIHQTHAFGSAARLYADEADRFFSASMLVWLSFLVAVSLAVAALAALAFALGVTLSSSGKVDSGDLLILSIPGAAVALVLLVAAGAAQVVLNDFILPHMVIEGAPFPRAWAAARARIAAAPESFLRYFLLRMGLPLAAGLVLGLLAWVVESIAFGILGISAAGFADLLNGAPGWRTFLLAAVRGVFTLLGLGAGAAIAVSFAGPLGVFMRSYALVFYGRHYQALGNLLDPAGYAAQAQQARAQSAR